MRLPIMVLVAILAGGVPVAGAGKPGGAVQLDVPYAEGGDQHKLDLYLPEQKGFTTIVFTYGGGWHTGSRKSVTLIGKQFQRLGFGCALLSPNYSDPARQGFRPGASSPWGTPIRPGAAPEAHRPLTPIWGRQRKGLSNGSARRMGNGNREWGTQALTHPTVPIQVRPA